MRRRPCLGRHGFSLIELLLVLILLGLIAGVAAPATGRLLDQLAFRKETGALLAQLRAARLLATGTGQVVSVGISGHDLWQAEGKEEPQPLASSETLAVHFDPATITFYPEGFATPAVIKVSRGKKAARFTIDPLTGLPVRES
jgi:general secretion pathway protein H